MAKKKKISTGIQRTVVLRLIERIESVQAEIVDLRDDVKSIYAEAKAAGLDTPTLRKVIKIRNQDEAERTEAEALLDTYLGVIGFKSETPLFKAVGLMKVDLAARDAVIAAFKQLVPTHGEVRVTMGGAHIRLWRNEDGTAQAEEITELPHMTIIDPVGPTKAEAKAAGDGAREEGREAATVRPGARNPYKIGTHERAEWDIGYRMALEPA